MQANRNPETNFSIIVIVDFLFSPWKGREPVSISYCAIKVFLSPTVNYKKKRRRTINTPYDHQSAVVLWPRRFTTCRHETLRERNTERTKPQGKANVNKTEICLLSYTVDVFQPLVPCIPRFHRKRMFCAHHFLLLLLPYSIQSLGNVRVGETNE